MGNSNKQGKPGTKTSAGAKKASKEKTGMTKREVTIMAVAGVVVVAAVSAVVLFFTLGNDSDDVETLDTPLTRGTVGSRGTVVTEENLQEIAEQFRQPVEDDRYTVSMDVRWKFERWDVPADPRISNPADKNTRTVYIDVTLVDDGRLVYTSPYLPVGEKLPPFALSEPLEAGVYPATVTYFLVDDEKNVITDVSVRVTLEILN